jgi:hypothetical protein
MGELKDQTQNLTENAGVIGAGRISLPSNGRVERLWLSRLAQSAVVASAFPPMGELKANILTKTKTMSHQPSQQWAG